MSCPSRCFYCICPICNRRRCLMYRCRHGLLERCMYCLQNYTVATTECDYFEMKYKKHCYRIIRKGKTPMQRIESKLDAILKNSEG